MKVYLAFRIRLYELLSSFGYQHRRGFYSPLSDALLPAGDTEELKIDLAKGRLGREGSRYQRGSCVGA